MAKNDQYTPPEVEKWQDEILFSIPKLHEKPRVDLFSLDEKKAIQRALEEFVPVFASGKSWNPVAQAAITLLEEFSIAIDGQNLGHL